MPIALAVSSVRALLMKVFFTRSVLPDGRTPTVRGIGGYLERTNKNISYACQDAIVHSVTPWIDVEKKNEMGSSAGRRPAEGEEQKFVCLLSSLIDETVLLLLDGKSKPDLSP